MNRFVLLTCVLLLSAEALPAQPNGKIQKSLVRITATEVEPDYRAPWNSGASSAALAPDLSSMATAS